MRRAEVAPTVVGVIELPGLDGGVDGLAAPREYGLAFLNDHGPLTATLLVRGCSRERSTFRVICSATSPARGIACAGRALGSSLEAPSARVARRSQVSGARWHRYPGLTRIPRIARTTFELDADSVPQTAHLWKSGLGRRAARALLSCSAAALSRSVFRFARSDCLARLRRSSSEISLATGHYRVTERGALRVVGSRTSLIGHEPPPHAACTGLTSAPAL